MNQFSVIPKICEYSCVKEFLDEFQLKKGDLLLISEHIKEKYFNFIEEEILVVHYRKYGNGEPTDSMVEAMYKEIKDHPYTRVIAVGGGTILDVAKLFALKEFSPVVDLFEKKMMPMKEKELILVPTTCGTGSEVTNISILELTAIQSKLGLAADALYADYAILIPQLLKELPLRFFATSSIDALIHGVESFTSPKATTSSKLYSREAITIIIKGYQELITTGLDLFDEKFSLLADRFLNASMYAGIAFGNAGCAAVHALSYPLGANFHIPHGEANYAMFLKVYEYYLSRCNQGAIHELNLLLANLLDCSVDEVYQQLETLLNHLLLKKSLREFGVKKEDLRIFTKVVIEKQTRLMNNNFIPLTEEDVYQIYLNAY